MIIFAKFPPNSSQRLIKKIYENSIKTINNRVLFYLSLIRCQYKILMNHYVATIDKQEIICQPSQRSVDFGAIMTPKIHYGTLWHHETHFIKVGFIDIPH